MYLYRSTLIVFIFFISISCVETNTLAGTIPLAELVCTMALPGECTDDDLIHLYAESLSSGESFSATFSPAHAQVSIKNIPAGYYEICCYILRIKSETTLYAVYTRRYEKVCIHDQIDFVPCFIKIQPQLLRFAQTDECTELSLTTAPFSAMFYVSAFTLQDTAGKFVKYNSLVNKEESTTALFEGEFPLPPVINISFAIKSKYDKDYFKNLGITVTTSRFEACQLNYSH